MIVGAFGNLLAGTLNANPSVPLGIVVLALAGMLAGQMLYKWKMDLIVVTLVVVGVTLLAILVGPLPEIVNAVKGFNSSLNTLGLTIYFVDVDGLVKPFTTSYMFWLLFVVAFSYLGATLPIWRYAQPVNYIGFWVMALTIVGGWLGAAVAVFVKPTLANFVLPAFTTFDAGKGGALQPLWPMLFVTIACGAISGWHSLVSTVGTGRQLEYETDALPVGAGSMFSEMLLAMLALMAISVAGKGAGAAAFANGVGQFLNIFGLDAAYGAALGFASFVIIVITVTQLAVRFMRVVLAEWAGDYVAHRQERPRGYAHLLDSDDHHRPEWYVHLPLANLRRGEPINGSAGADAGVAVAGFREKESHLRRDTDGVYVRHHHRCQSHLCLQSVGDGRAKTRCQARIVVCRSGRGRDDHHFVLPHRRCPLHRL